MVGSLLTRRNTSTTTSTRTLESMRALMALWSYTSYMHWFKKRSRRRIRKLNLRKPPCLTRIAKSPTQALTTWLTSMSSLTPNPCNSSHWGHLDRWLLLIRMKRLIWCKRQWATSSLICLKTNTLTKDSRKWSSRISSNSKAWSRRIWNCSRPRRLKLLSKPTQCKLLPRTLKRRLTSSSRN